MSNPILSVRDLCVDYITDDGPVRAIDHVSLDIEPGEILGIAGESGSGKSTLAQAIMRTLQPPAVISHGEVWFEGKNVLTMSEPELQTMRWRRMSMVFQSAMDALNPVTTIGEQIMDTVLAHGAGNAKRARERAAELLELVGIPASRLDSHAHQLSGGMRQRVGIAIALALEPALVILDEPTTALDVIVEREILEEIQALQKKLKFAVIFITHDLHRMLQFSDRVAVFYAARVAEVAPVAELRRAPRHPYTQGLLHAFPTLEEDSAEPTSIPGNPPSLERPPGGCRFHPRCSVAIAECQTREPKANEIASGHRVACLLVE